MNIKNNNTDEGAEVRREEYPNDATMNGELEINDSRSLKKIVSGIYVDRDGTNGWKFERKSAMNTSNEYDTRHKWTRKIKDWRSIYEIKRRISLHIK